MTVENCPHLAQFPVPAFVVAQCGESAVAARDPVQLLDAALEKHHGIRDEVSRDDEQVRVESRDQVGVTPYLFPGHVNAGVHIGELDNPQAAARAQTRVRRRSGHSRTPAGWHPAGRR